MAGVDSRGHREPAPEPPGLARRVVAVARDQGLRRLAAGALAHLGYRRMIVFERSLRDLPPPRVPPPGATVERLDAAAVDDYLRLRPDTPASRVRARLAAGCVCHAVRFQGNLVAAGWTGSGRVRVDYFDADVDFPAGVAYYHDMYSVASWRSRGIGTILVSHQLAALAAAGLDRIHGASVPENRASIRVCLKLGYHAHEWLVAIGYAGARRIVRRPWRGPPLTLDSAIARRNASARAER